MTIRRNERSWAISLISDINAMLIGMRLQIARAGGESTISHNGESMFPDVLLYGDEEQTQILQGWELKLPDVSITDAHFIADATRKAEALKVNSFVIWNFTAGALYIKRASGFRAARTWNQTAYIRTRAHVEQYRNDWFPIIREIILTVNEYLITGTITGSVFGEVISDTVVTSIISRNKDITAAAIRSTKTVDSSMRAYLDVWWGEVKADFAGDEDDGSKAYAKVLLLHWSNRLLFAHLLKPTHNPAREIDKISRNISIIEASAIFKRISAACDFYNVFMDLPYDTVLPAQAWGDLLMLNAFLSENGLRRVKQAALQLVLENTIAHSKRRIGGQFATPVKLASILAQITVKNLTQDVIDPCCGTGTILKAVLDLKMKSDIPISECMATTWGSDKHTFALQTATLSMTSPESMNQPIRIYPRSVFNQRTGDNVEVTNPSDGQHISLQIPQFGAVVSNLPFVQFESIDPSEYSGITEQISLVKRATGKQLNNRSDLYQYVLFALHRILADEGRVGVITSNSWLGTAAGLVFFQALAHYFKVKQLHISHAGRWFSNSQVVTVIIVLEKRSVLTHPGDDEITTFWGWKKSLPDIQVEEIANPAIMEIAPPTSVACRNAYTMKAINELLGLSLSLNTLFHDAYWIVSIANKLTKVSNVFDVFRGERRGWDVMFYPAGGHGIEGEYIRHVLKSSRTVSHLDCSYDNEAFCCSLSLEQLKRKGHTGAINWIKRFEGGVNETGKPLVQVLARRNMFWYEMKDQNRAELITSINPGSRLFFSRFSTPSFVNQRLTGLTPRENSVDVELAHALLNSVFEMFMLEAIGFGRGLGALDLNKDAIASSFMLNPNLVTKANRSRILRAFEPLRKRPILNTNQELAQDDRTTFDRIVLEAYDMGRYHEAIKKSLLSAQAARLSVNT